MFFSDELIAIGRKSNPKSNLSMNEHLNKMLGLCRTRINGCKHYEYSWVVKNTASCFNFALRTLYKEGYSYFSPEKWAINPQSTPDKL